MNMEHVVHLKGSIKSISLYSILFLFYCLRRHAAMDRVSLNHLGSAMWFHANLFRSVLHGNYILILKIC